MRLRNWLLAAALATGGSCLADNPRNCVLTSNACGQGERCNMGTQRCEPLDCTVNTTLCAANEYCDGLARRCIVKNCVRDPSLCTETQDCDTTTQMCQTRSFVLGEPDEKTNLAAAYGMSNPQGVLLIPEPAPSTRIKLIVADTGNQRVLIWNDLPTSNRPADVVLGAPDVHTLNGGNPYGGVNERSMTSTWSMTSDGNRLIVADQVLHRILVWNPIPTQPSGAEPIPANQVWGQIDFEASAANGGNDTTTSQGVNGPGVYLVPPPSAYAGHFFIADRGNNRVLSFPAGVPLVPQAVPAGAAGQPDFVNNAPNTTDRNLREPRSMASDGSRLFVCDTKNHRVIIFPLPITGFTAAAPMVGGVFGQGAGGGLLTTGAPNIGGLITASSLALPITCAIPASASSAKQIFVADSGNNRVLRYSFNAGATPTAADRVFGQAGPLGPGNALVNRGGMPSAATLNNPFGVASDGTRVAIADTGNNRVLLWQTMPTTDGQDADVILGQPNAATNTPNTPPVSMPIPYSLPLGVETDGAHLAVADAANHRVLIWNSIPRNGSTPPDVVVGQNDFTSRLPNAGQGTPTAETLANPQGIFFDGQRMIIADTGNNRVLLYNQIPTTNFARADYVVGNSDFNLRGPRLPGQFGLSQPTEAVMANGKLYVADFGHHRVYIYNDPWKMDPMPSLALGQLNTTLAGVNYGGQSASSLANPRSVRVYGNKLLVVDRSNHRVLIWNSLPTMNFQPANVVVGQTGFGASYTRTDRAQLSLPRSLLVHEGRLYVSAQNQNRILYWNEIPTKNGQRADGVLGQTDYLSSYPNNPDLPPVERLSAPVGMTAYLDQLFIADSLNNRVVVRALP